MKGPITPANPRRHIHLYEEVEHMIYGQTDEQLMIADTVRSFVEKEIYPHEELVERTGEVPAEIAQEIRQKTLDLGFYACNFPESVGCAGLNHVEFAHCRARVGAWFDGAEPFFWATSKHLDGM